ncbi:hypothetical protein HMPREF1545_02596 [Oscillibacter sp. KLE 1728]|nr:hypothetical protein HMPREF1545_02596 [Oscillibacter sp. KLE 1728]
MRGRRGRRAERRQHSSVWPCGPLCGVNGAEVVSFARQSNLATLAGTV